MLRVPNLIQVTLLRKLCAAFLAQNLHSGGNTQCSHAVDMREDTICSAHDGKNKIMNRWSKLSLAMRSHPILCLNLSSQGWARTNHFLLCWKDTSVFQKNGTRAQMFTGWTSQVRGASVKSVPKVGFTLAFELCPCSPN